MNEYQVTYSNGEIIEIEAWTPEAAQAIAEEEADLNGCSGMDVTGVELLAARPLEL